MQKLAHRCKEHVNLLSESVSAFDIRPLIQFLDIIIQIRHAQIAAGMDVVCSFYCTCGSGWLTLACKPSFRYYTYRAEFNYISPEFVFT
jgi:hypothetical protein